MGKKKIVSIVTALSLLCVLALPVFASYTNFNVSFPPLRNATVCAQGTKDYNNGSAYVSTDEIKDNWLFKAYYYITGSQNGEAYHWVADTVYCDEDSYCYLPYDSTAKKGMHVILNGGCDGVMYTYVESSGFVNFD